MMDCSISSCAALRPASEAQGQGQFRTVPVRELRSSSDEMRGEDLLYLFTVSIYCIYLHICLHICLQIHTYGMYTIYMLHFNHFR